MALTFVKASGIDTSGSYTMGNLTSTANVSAGNILTNNLLYANGAAWTFGQPPGGSNTQIQFNDAGTFNGSAGLVFDKVTTSLTVNNFIATSTANLGSNANITITGGTTGQVLTTNGSGVLSWSTAGAGGGGATITDDTTTNANTFYPAMANATSGTYSTAFVSSTKMYFNPSTGTLNSTIFNSLSDETMKSELVQISDALEKVKQLTGYIYTITESGERSAGLLSQQVNKVLPEAVRTNEGVQSLNYNATIGLLVESIKILSDKIDLINQKLG